MTKQTDKISLLPLTKFLIYCSSLFYSIQLIIIDDNKKIEATANKLKSPKLSKNDAK